MGGCCSKRDDEQRETPKNTPGHHDKDEKKNDDDTQQLLVGTKNGKDYLSITTHPPINEQKQNNDYRKYIDPNDHQTDYNGDNDDEEENENEDFKYAEYDSNDMKSPSQTPPIIKSLFGQTPKHKDFDSNSLSPSGSNNAQNQDDLNTPGRNAQNLYIGYQENNSPLRFQRNYVDPLLHPNISNTKSEDFEEDDWVPKKQKNTKQKAPVLMGYMNQGEMISFHHLQDDVNNDDMKSSDTIANSDSGHSLNSAHLADTVIDEQKEGQIASSSSQSCSHSNSYSSGTYTITPWMIATYNVFIEYFPYRHIMAQIFSFCNVNINKFDFSFPDTTALEAKYNFYDVPDLFIENVSSHQLNQPSLVLMIGSPGSGKTSYATYRYSKSCVVSADDYFERYHQGTFVGSKLEEAHKWCSQEALSRLYKQETVVVANTNASFWQLYNQIIPALFDPNLKHKIVFAVMPEMNSSILVRRCLHGCTKSKIKKYVRNIQQMLGVDLSISVQKVLKYGNLIDPNEKKTNKNAIEYGLWIEMNAFESLKDWFCRYTNCHLLNDFGDGRISPTVNEEWNVYKEQLNKIKDVNINKFNFTNDPVVNLEVRVIGYSNHPLCKLVVVEVMKESVKCDENEIEKVFWNMFENEVNIEMMGCVLSMKKDIPFSNAKYLIDYDCIQYIDDGIIISTKLTTKRYARNAIREALSKKLLEECNKKSAINEANGDLNPNAAEFKLDDAPKTNEKKLNPSAFEFTPEKPKMAQFNSWQAQQLVNNLMIQQQQQNYLSQSMMNLNAMNAYRMNMPNTMLPQQQVSPNRMMHVNNMMPQVSPNSGLNNGNNHMIPSHLPQNGAVGLNKGLNHKHLPGNGKPNYVANMIPTQAPPQKQNNAKRRANVHMNEQQSLAYPAWDNIQLNMQQNKNEKH